MKKLLASLFLIAALGCATAGLPPSELLAPAAGHNYAWQGFIAALDGRPIPNLEQVRAIAKQQQPANLVALARAALHHAGLMTDAEFDRHWLVKRAPDETGSPLYHLTWGVSAICSVGTPQARVACRGNLAWAALAAAPWSWCEVQDHKGAWGNRARTTSAHGWPGEQYAGAGNRYGWEPRKCKPLVDRVPPAWRWAQGYPVQYRGWGDGTTGFPAAVLRDSIRKYGITLPRDADGLVAILNEFPTQPRQRFDVLRWENGNVLTVMDRSQMQTRQPVCATTVKAGVLRLVSASIPAPSGNGQWQSCWGKVDDSPDHPGMLRVRVGSDQRRVAWEVPRKGLVFWSYWNEHRAESVLGDTPPPPGPGPPPGTPPPGPRGDLPRADVAPALLAWDAIIQQFRATHPHRAQALATAAELLRRLAQDPDPEAARRAHRTLGDLLEGIE